MIGNPLTQFVGAFVEELARSGLRHVCLCPGSRSTPLALLLRRHPKIRVWVHLDERSAAYFALGMAKALRAPVGVVSTSGTAASNFMPAVTEAHHARVPLLVLTADRPHELRDVGSTQTIDQVRIFGSRAKWSVDMPLPDMAEDTVRYARVVACRAIERARLDPPGPVHLNFPFREPLIPAGEVEPEGDRPMVFSTGGTVSLGADALAGVAAELKAARRGLIVCGPQDDPSFPRAVMQLAEVLCFPVLADALSQVRCGAHHGPQVLDAYDSLLRVPSLGAVQPDLVLRFGAMPTSKSLQEYLLRHAQAPQIMIDLGEGWNDPSLVVGQVLRCNPTRLCRDLVLVLGKREDEGRGGDWLERWQTTDRAGRGALTDVLENTEALCEPRIFQELSDLLPEGATLFVGNSMPVRDLDAYLPGGKWPLRCMASRGASGIDGVLSSALGTSAVIEGPVVLILGDLSFYHDINGLFAARQFGLDATIILVNNDGGGVFSFLPQAEHAPHFEELFGTPHGLDFHHAAKLFGIRYQRVGSWSQFRNAVGRSLAARGVEIVEVRTNRDDNADLHRDLWAAVAAEVSGG